MNIVFLQKNSGKAGAQHALKRMLETHAIKEHNVSIVCSEEGWIVDKLRNKNIHVVVLKYPSYGSLIAKLFKVDLWVNKLISIYKISPFIPDIVIANNHIESPYALKIKQKYKSNILTSVFLRDSTMSKKDYFKNRCEQIDIKLTVSSLMKNLIPYEDNIYIANDGLSEKEFYLVKIKPKIFPKKVLLIGAPHLIKGWDIFFQVIDKIYKEKNIILFDEVICTGVPSLSQLKSYGFTNEELKKYNIVFHKKFDGLKLESRKYDLSIFTSRNESFALAPLEVIAAGVPVLSSNVGVVPDIITSKDFIFDVGSEKSLEDKLLNLYYNWDSINTNMSVHQKNIKEKFNIEKEINKLMNIYKRELSL